MAIEFSYNDQYEFVICTVIGNLCFDDYDKYMQQLLADNDIPVNANALWDLRKMQFDNIDLEFEEKLINVMKMHTEKRGSAKVAIVSDYVLGEPLVKLFLILSEELNQNIKMFKTVEEAELWLIGEVNPEIT